MIINNYIYNCLKSCIYKHQWKIKLFSPLYIVIYMLREFRQVTSSLWV